MSRHRKYDVHIQHKYSPTIGINGKLSSKVWCKPTIDSHSQHYLFDEMIVGGITWTSECIVDIHWKSDDSQQCIFIVGHGIPLTKVHNWHHSIIDIITRKCIIFIITNFKFHLYKMMQTHNLNKIFSLFSSKTIQDFPTNFKNIDTSNTN